jgi:gentisate 1,2-dioxygenase
VFVVVEGEGRAEIDGVDHALNLRDVLTVPSWKGLRLSATRDLVLFAFSDKASQDKLNLYKEDRE